MASLSTPLYLRNLERPHAWLPRTIRHVAARQRSAVSMLCAGRMQLIATIEDPAVIQRILAHLGLLCQGQEPEPRPAMTDNECYVICSQPRSRKPSVIAFTTGMPFDAMALMRALTSASARKGFLSRCWA